MEAPFYENLVDEDGNPQKGRVNLQTGEIQLDASLMNTKVELAFVKDILKQLYERQDNNVVACDATALRTVIGIYKTEMPIDAIVGKVMDVIIEDSQIDILDERLQTIEDVISEYE